MAKKEFTKFEIVERFFALTVLATVGFVGVMSIITTDNAFISGAVAAILILFLVRRVW